MTLHPTLYLIFIPLLAALCPAMATASDNASSDLHLTLTEAQLERVGRQIYQNECAGRPACLVHWNKGEAFPSLGIGHFIWYPADTEEPFTESFPALIRFMEKQGLALPQWLKALQPLDAPWPDRSAFLDQRDSEEVVTLRQFLDRTQGAQARFMFNRAEASLMRVVGSAPGHERETILQRLKSLSATPGGVYALIDYVNFKGEGLAEGESYQGHGWGLLQVLQNMAGGDGSSPLEQFRQAAVIVLTRRADNAPRAIERQRWLPGWLKRLETYREI